MDSTRDEENEYSSIDYDCLAVDRESTNFTSRSQLRSSEGNTYEEPSSAVKKREQKAVGETLPLFKNEEWKKQNSNRLNQESTSYSIKDGLLILLILLTSALSLLLCLHYLEVLELPNRGLKAREEAMLNEEIKKNASILMGIISSQKKTISEKEAAIQQHVEDLTQLKSNASTLRQQMDELKAVIASRDVDINRLKNKINELAPEHTSIMLLGGWHDYPTNSTTIYNSMEKSWKNCKLTLPSTLAAHGTALLNDEIYIFGGYEDGATQEALKSLYKLRSDNKWERMADMNEKRRSISQSFVVFNSEIWVIGGWDGTKVFKSVEKYNLKTKKWTKMPELNESRTRAAATVIDGKIYVSGGWDVWKTKNSVEVYDPEKGKWEIFTPSMPYEVDSHILIGNHSHLIAIGGDLSSHEPTNQVWKLDVLDPKREWKEMPSLQQKRYHSGAAIIADELMVFGGSINNVTRIDSVEIFDGVKWKNGAPLPEKRIVFASIPLTCAQERLFLNQFCQNS